MLVLELFNVEFRKTATPSSCGSINYESNRVQLYEMRNVTIFPTPFLQIATNPKYPDMILSASRDKTLIVWKLTRDDSNYGIPQKRLHGHGHFVSDVVLSSDGHFALSGSWDKTLRLWDLSAGRTTRRFEDHTKV